MSKQPRKGSFTAPAPSSTGVSRDLLSALPGRKVAAHLWERAIALEPTFALTPTHCLSAMVPAHICRELCRTGAFFFFFSLVTESLSSSESVAFPVLYPLWFCSETRCFFKAFQQEAFDNLLVLSQVYIKAQQWSRISSNGYGTEFFPLRCGWFAIFPKHAYDLHRAVLWKGNSFIFFLVFVSQNSIPGHRKHIPCHHMWTNGQERIWGKKEIYTIYIFIQNILPWYTKFFLYHTWTSLVEHGKCYISAVCFQLLSEN